jgi:hypothetical protein
MAFHRISSHELAKVGHALGRAEKTKHAAKERANRAKCAAETVGGGLAIGFVRGKMEDANGQWLIPGTTLDIEMVAGAALVLGPLLAPMAGVDALEEYEEDLISVGAGVLAHYTGQAGRNFAKTGTLSWPMVAGAPVLGGRAPVLGATDLADALSALTPR